MIKGRLKATPFRRPTVKLCAGQIGILGVERIQPPIVDPPDQQSHQPCQWLVLFYFTVRTAIASASV